MISRRGANLNSSNDDERQSSSPKASISAPPRSGQFIVPIVSTAVVDKDDSNKHHKFRVHLPTRMLCMLGFVFLLIPVCIFIYKEAHIGMEQQNAPHFKTEKFVNVNTADVLSQMARQKQEVESFDEKEVDESTSSDSDSNKDDKDVTEIDEGLKGADTVDGDEQNENIGEADNSEQKEDATDEADKTERS